MLWLAQPAIGRRMLQLYNSVLHQGEYPKCWKEFVTVILRKANKPDYTSAKAYRPIALLNTLGKTLELIIASRLTEWAITSGAIPERHFGGRRGAGMEDALLKLDTWTRDK